MKSLIYRLINLLFPHYCLGCRTNGPIICKNCLAKIPPPERDLPRGIYSIFDYRDPVIKKALWNLKYGNIPELAYITAPLMYETIAEILYEEYALIEFKKVIVVPIPTSGDKTKKRTYNHAYKIAEAVVRHQNKLTMKNPATILTIQGGSSKLNQNKWQLLDLLTKIKKTERQAMVKGRDKRIKNIQGAYSIKKEFLKLNNTKSMHDLENSFFIIIDDITTTGASITEAMRALKTLKPRHVFGITIAH
ncbi:MAG: ComF family protein [Minisyncoccia bacterium]